MVKLLIKNKEGILVSDLNPFFDEENLSYDTLKKRRETFLRNLKMKLSEVSHLKQNECLIDSKSEKDRRVKVIHLNEALTQELASHLSQKG